MKKTAVTLKKEIILEITVLLIAALLIIGVVLLKLTTDFLIRQRVATSHVVIESLINRLTSKTFNGDINTRSVPGKFDAKKLVNLLIHKSIFNSFVLADKTGSILVSFPDRKDGKLLAAREFTKKIRIGKFFVENDTGTLLHLRKKGGVVVTAPVILNGRLKGGVRGVVKVDDIEENIGKILMMVIVYIMFDAIVFIFVGAYLLSKSVVNPLHELVEVAEAVTIGDFSKEINIENENEIGQLARSFNVMIGSLSEKISLLKNKNIELEQVKREIIQTEKLSSLGRLAAGVAHEIGNPLGSLKTYIDILLQDSTKETVDILLRMEKDSGRIDKIVRELLIVSSPSRGVVGNVNINGVLKEIVGLIKNRNGFEKVKINLSLADNLPDISIDEQKIQQVFINLLINSSDAMDGDGEISVSSKLIQCDNRQIKNKRFTDFEEADFLPLRVSGSFPVGEKNRLISLVFSDTGTGIKKEDMQKLFDPFFTTKEPGKGTGLGLSICHRIIADFGGKIIISSVIGKGTKIEILLPATDLRCQQERIIVGT